MGMDRETGELYSTDSKEAMEKLKEDNPNIEDVPYSEFERMVSMTPRQRLEYYSKKKAKTRANSKIARKSQQRNRR